MEQLEKDVTANKTRLAKKAAIARKKRGRNTSDKNKFAHRDWIQEQVLQYLKSTACVNLHISKLNELKSKCMSTKKNKRRPQQKNERQQSTPLTASQTSGYGLTEAEAIQILNFMPQEPVEIHLMVEDLHARMSETKQEEFLAMIRSYNSSLTNNNDDDEDQSIPAVNDEKSDEIVDESIKLLEQAEDHTLCDDHDNQVLIKREI